MREPSPVIGWIEIEDAPLDFLHAEPEAQRTQVLVANLAQLTHELEIEWRAVLANAQLRRPRLARVAGRGGLR